MGSIRTKCHNCRLSLESECRVPSFVEKRSRKESRVLDKKEQKVDIGINQLLDENRAVVNALSSPTCIYLLYLIRSRPGITCDQIDVEYTFKTGTSSEWLGYLREVGLVEERDSCYYLSPFAEKRLELVTGAASNKGV